MKHLDLFSGIGGFALAAKWAGYETVAFCEIDKFCQKVLTKHWPDVVIHHDIRNFIYEHNVDLLTAGFPCQPFSVAGKKKGKNDERYLWPETLRIIQQCRPSWIVAENVIGILAMEIKDIISDLENENYSTQILVLPACAANAPHRRDRVWIIAFHNCLRSNEWISDWQKRYFQNDKEWNIASLQSEWEQFKPKSWSTHQAKDWLQFNASASRRDDGLPNRLDRIKSLGNAIVPQIAYPILRLIKEIESEIIKPV